MHASRFSPLVLLAALTACEGPSSQPFDESQPQLASYGRWRPRDAGPRCPEPAPMCLFGSSFPELRTNPAIVIATETWITSESELAGELEAAQLVLAVQQSSHTDVTTAAEALARVDQQEVRVMELLEAAGDRAFTVYEYGAGDNSYGAIFAAGTTELATHIHDGDLLDCRALAP